MAGRLDGWLAAWPALYIHHSHSLSFTLNGHDLGGSTLSSRPSASVRLPLFFVGPQSACPKLDTPQAAGAVQLMKIELVLLLLLVPVVSFRFAAGWLFYSFFSFLLFFSLLFSLARQCRRDSGISHWPSLFALNIVCRIEYSRGRERRPFNIHRK